MSDKELIVILRDLKELYNLPQQHRFYFFPREGSIILEIAEIDEFEKIHWQNKLQNYFFSCGCQESALMSIVFFMAYWLFNFNHEGLEIFLSFEVWILAVTFLLIGGLIGKTMGLVYSRYALFAVVRKLLLSVYKKL
jgi:hypothetical protein